MKKFTTVLALVLASSVLSGCSSEWRVNHCHEETGNSFEWCQQGSFGSIVCNAR